MVSIATLVSQLGFLQKFLGILEHAGLPGEFYQKVIDDPEFRAEFVVWAKKVLDRNPFRQSVDTQLAALRRANEGDEWDIPETEFDRLAACAPEWPEGRLAFRSLRIRFGEGDAGVHKTFKAHALRIIAVFQDCGVSTMGLGQIFPKEDLCNEQPMTNLRLLVGNHEHKPTLEWVIIDLDEHRKRNSITEVRGPNSLADELLVFMWMFPRYIQSMDLKTYPGVFAGGYEIHLAGDGSWSYVLSMGSDGRGRNSILRFVLENMHSQNPHCSVPTLRDTKKTDG